MEWSQFVSNMGGEENTHGHQLAESLNLYDMKLNFVICSHNSLTVHFDRFFDYIKNRQKDK